MNIKQKIIAVLLVCGGQACIAQVVAPEVIASAGGYSSNSQTSLSWTFGEPITATENTGNYYLTQGFQQPASIVLTAVNNPPSSQSSVSVYPNPVSSSIYIQRDGNEQLQIHLMDMNGKLILNKMLSSSENQLDLSVLANGMYLLKVYDMHNQFVQSLKIEKVK
jgi:hypothetical protein